MSPSPASSRIRMYSHAIVGILLPLWGKAGWGLLVAEDDPAARQVVGREVDPDAVADKDPDVELAHLAGGVGEDGLAGLQLDLEHGVRQGLDHLGVHLDGLLFAGRGLLGFQRVDAGAQRSRTAALLRVATSLTQIVAMIAANSRGSEESRHAPALS